MRIYLITGTTPGEEGDTIAFVGTSFDKAKEALVKCITPDEDGCYLKRFWDLVAYEDNSTSYVVIDSFRTKDGSAPQQDKVVETYDHDPFNKGK